MGNSVAGVNQEILKWARERAGYTLSEVAQKMNKDAAVIEAWESGKAAPTYPQLEKLAYQLYKRPVALFFFPEPPDEIDPGRSFRTLPDSEIDKFAPDTRYALRQALALQMALYELTDGRNPSGKKIFRDIQITPDTPFDWAATAVREYLGVSLEAQLSWRNVQEALTVWRQVVQDSGIFVFKRAFKQKGISGFCLYDDEFPIIYLNNGTAVSRQIFTLFHELAHLLLRTNGVTQVNMEYIDSLHRPARDIELFCNRFAAEFLVPSSHFDTRLSDNTPINDQWIRNIAKAYSVSREVILRRLLDKGLVTSEYYRTKINEWYSETSKKGGSGGNYYATQITYLGDKFLNIAFDKYYSGRASIEQIADYLDMKVPTVMELEARMMQRVVG